jgi:hypothetical protein
MLDGNSLVWPGYFLARLLLHCAYLKEMLVRKEFRVNPKRIAGNSLSHLSIQGLVGQVTTWETCKRGCGGTSGRNAGVWSALGNPSVTGPRMPKAASARLAAFAARFPSGKPLLMPSTGRGRHPRSEPGVLRAGQKENRAPLARSVYAGFLRRPGRPSSATSRSR